MGEMGPMNPDGDSLNLNSKVGFLNSRPNRAPEHPVFFGVWVVIGIGIGGLGVFAFKKPFSMPTLTPNFGFLG
jgi:hypothetical protein